LHLNDYEDFPTTLPILTEDDIFLYPFMIAPIFLSSEKNIAAATNAVENNSLILVTPTKQAHAGESNFDAIYDAGVVGSIMRKTLLPDGRVKVLFQGLARGHIKKQIADEHFLEAEVDLIKSKVTNELKMDAILEVVREKVRQLSKVSNYFPPDLLRTIEENHEPDRIADLISSSVKMKKEQAYSLFIEEDVEKRFLGLIDYLLEEIEANKIQKEIRSKVQSHMDNVNKEYFLKEQLKQIQRELGSDTQREEEIEEYRKKLEAKKSKMGEDAYKETNKQLERFARMHPDSADAGMIQTYLEWVLEVPFGDESKKSLKIEDVEAQLDKDHFSLKKPKKRIVEYVYHLIMKLSNSEQFELYKQLFELENEKVDLENKESRNNLASFIKQKRKQINTLLKQK